MNHSTPAAPKPLQKRYIFFLLFVFISVKSFAQPTISSFSPAAGPVGSAITITGTNFNPTPAGNIVFIGGIRVNATAATTTTLTVTIPAGMANQPISVTVNGLTAYSNKPFIVTFPGAAPQFSPKSFEYGGRVDSINSDIETTKYTIGDIDTDGKIDVITVDRLNNTFSVYRNTSAGGAISFSPKIDFTTAPGPRAVAIADIDGDGKPDVVVTNLTANTVSVFKNTTGGGIISFAAKVDFGTATQPSGISVTDIDKDGKPDLVINTINIEGYVSVLRNTGSGATISFAPKMDLQSIGGSIEEIRTADIDGDNKTDIVLPNFGLGQVTIFRNTSTTGVLSFAPKVDVATNGYPHHVEISDLNNDGKPDLAVGYYLTGDDITILRNASVAGTVSFNAPVDYSTQSYTKGIAIDDLDGDGKPDLAVGKDDNTVALYKNNSNAGGAIALNFTAGFVSPWYSPILTGDFDNDGKPDISFTSGVFRVTVWKNRTTSPQIFSFSPAAANTGTTVTIQGVHFTGVNAVSFGGVPAASFTVVNDNTITAVVGAGASGDIVVTKPGDMARIDGFIFTAPPVITSFNPVSAATGATVTITGNYFSGATAVVFGSTAAASFTVVDQHTITAVVANGSSGGVYVTTQYGTGALAGFTYLPVPTISTFTPTSGGTGTVIAINGTNFTGATSVMFGGVPAASFTVVSAERIDAVVNTGSSGNISVTTAFGTAEKAGFTYIPPPVITSFTPASGQTGTTITITGTNLSSVNSVQFGGVAASGFTKVNATTITAVVGTGASGNITVQSPYGNSSLPGFTYLSRPVITSFTPASGPVGTTITITGKYFSDVTAVYFSGVPAASFTIVSDESIVAVSGDGNTGLLTLINPIGSGFSTNDFTFIYPAPSFTSFSPASGAQGAQISITGSNFLPGRTVVRFGGVPAGVIVNSSTSITATVAAGASGDVSVTTPGGHAALPGFTYIPPPPRITSVYPQNATEGMSVEIHGERFNGVTAISFGGVPASSFTVNSDEYITAIVGAGASGDVAVTTGEGTGTYPGFVHGPVTITSISPSTGGQGTVVTITGTGFVHVNNVYFGSVSASNVTVHSPTSLTATVRDGASGFVTVRTQSGLHGRKDGFIYISPNTSIHSITPLVGSVGSIITINGSGFTGATMVSFGGIPASSFTVNSNHSITAVVAAGGSSGNISVTSPLGTANFSGFVFSGAPVITAFSPEAAAAGTSITISGYNFNATASNNIVYFGGLKANVKTASVNALTVEVPTGATYDYISVTNNGLTGFSQKKFDKKFLATAPLDANSFETKIDSASGVFPKHVTTADFDLDGKPDVVVCHTGGQLGTSFITVYKNNGSPGTISFLPKITITNDGGPLNSVAGDLDGDGKLDLIVGEAYDGLHVSVYKNTSTGTGISFGNETPLQGYGLSGNVVACADIDMDGKTDIICATAYPGSATILRNTSTGGTLSFARHVLLGGTGGAAAGVSVSDMDMDGKPDLVFSAAESFVSSNSASIIRNVSTPGNIAFEPIVSVPVGLYARGVSTGDVDGDGKNDIIVAADITNTLSVIRNLSIPGAIVMDNKKDLLSFRGPYAVAMGDVDGDGKPDVVSALDRDSYISLYRNTSVAGNISFGQKIDIATGAGPRSVSIADLDSDQRPDILAANNGSGTVSFIRNKMNAVLLQSFSPANGITGTVVTIKGTNLTGASAVSFGGVPASSFTVVDASTITAVVAAGSSGNVTVTTPAGTLTLSGFNYFIPPTITSFTPDTAAIGATINIKGTNFTGASAVQFGGVAAATFTVESDTTIRAFLAAGATGNVTVTTPGGTATRGGFVYGSKVVTGIVDPRDANSKELTASPNPSLDNLIIRHPASLKNARLRLIDIVGREVKTIFPARNSSKTETNVNHLLPGVYIILWTDGVRNLSRTITVL